MSNSNTDPPLARKAVQPIFVLVRSLCSNPSRGTGSPNVGRHVYPAILSTFVSKSSGGVKVVVSAAVVSILQ